jgi:SAM-dependent methyltransferase
MQEDPAEFPVYRYAVGRRHGFDLLGAVQVSLLWSLGLRETHKVCDVGCGSLRAGKLLIPYLDIGNYYGIDPNRWLVEQAQEHEVGSELLRLRDAHFDYGADFGIERFDTLFDYILAQSIFSHTYRDLTAQGLASIAATLAADGLFVGTFIEKFPLIMPQGNRAGPDDGHGWRETANGVVYTWKQWTELLDDAGLVGRRIRWYHQRQTWCVAVHKGQDARLRDAIRSSRNRLRGPGVLGHAQERALARVRRLRGPVDDASIEEDVPRAP